MGTVHNYNNMKHEKFKSHKVCCQLKKREGMEMERWRSI